MPINFPKVVPLFFEYHAIRNTLHNVGSFFTSSKVYDSLFKTRDKDNFLMILFSNLIFNLIVLSNLFDVY